MTGVTAMADSATPGNGSLGLFDSTQQRGAKAASRRETPYSDFSGVLIEAGQNLGAQQVAAVIAPDSVATGICTDLDDKRQRLSVEFAGQPVLLLNHALVIAVLRRVSTPCAARSLFHRYWAETCSFLVQSLSPRWLVSAATTFADHGETEVQRRVGRSVSILFNLIKLYETERRYSGFAPNRPFPRGQRSLEGLALGFEPFAIRDGDLDAGLLNRILDDAEPDDQMRALCQSLFRQLEECDGTVFHRIAKMRRKMLAKRGA